VHDVGRGQADLRHAAHRALHEIRDPGLHA
jgi:hypothetical protein